MLPLDFVLDDWDLKYAGNVIALEFVWLIAGHFSTAPLERARTLGGSVALVPMDISGRKLMNHSGQIDACEFTGGPTAICASGSEIAQKKAVGA